ncbi:MAG: DNA repair protein RecN [Acidobacteriaceae bacterium]|nr:DNA repair protein RecN [Acidobacteriaceae bacterium]MBV9782077.1 DNA repair protein RecN [Acidobacteriaceae bacterium]
MLLELIVENYAVVEQARIRFQEGLNVLTGETGSGKSLVVDSFSLLLGARASMEMIRTGEARARVSGIFALEQTGQSNTLFEEAGIEHNGDEELIVEREITSTGKSRAFVANRPVTTAFLRQLAPVLGDIHGQNEQQDLFRPAAQRELLDEYAAAEELRNRAASAYADWRAVGEKLAQLSQNEQEKLRLLDLWTFQRKEIEFAQPKPGEDAELEAERRVLQNVTRLQEHASAAFELLYESPESATTQLRQALKRIDELTRIDPSLQETSASLRQAAVMADEAGYALRDYLGKLEGDPKRLDDIEARLSALDRVKRKYGGSIDDVLAFLQDVTRRADEVEKASEHKSTLEKQQAELAARYESLAGELSRARTAAAERLSKQVESELKSLAMGGTRFEVAVKHGAWTATGMDEVAFLVSPNRGEELRLLEKIASGGELSRIALALKTAIGDADRHPGTPTLVFDEVDAGVGGAAAAAVGRRLKALSRRNQVICVTHLAQIAGFADHQYAVSKKEKKGRATAVIEELDTAQRAREIGRMLSGDHITPEALKHAEQLLAAGRARVVK